MRIKIVCPECGPQEHRGYRPPLVAEGQKHVFSRFMNQDDDTCPKCCTETLPQAAAESALALHVRVAATGYFEREAAAAFSQKERARIKANFKELTRGKRHLHVVAG